MAQGSSSPYFSTTRAVLFGDCDPAGAIYTPRAGHFVVEALLEFYAALLGGPAARTMASIGILPPAKALNIEFSAPLTYDDQLTMTVTQASVGSTSFTCTVDAIRQDGVIAFRGTLTQVCISAALPEGRTRRAPVEVPERLRNALVTYQARIAAGS